MDRDLCRRAAAHDRAAFGELYERYAGGIRNLLLTRGSPPEAAWDLVHETFARALHAFDRGRMPDRFDLWIRRIALNAFTDHWRRPYVRYEESTDPGVLPDGVTPATDRDLATAMRSLVETLDPTLRDVIVLHVYQDLSVQDVASVLRIPPGTVKSRLHRAYRRLGQALEVQDGKPEPGVRPSTPADERSEAGPRRTPTRFLAEPSGGRNER